MIFLLTICVLLNVAEVSAAISCKGKIVEKVGAKTDFTIPIDFLNKKVTFTTGWKDFFTSNRDDCEISSCVLMDKTCMLPYEGGKLHVAA